MPIMVSTMSPNMCKLCPRSIHTLKEDAKRFGLPFLNPCVNLETQVIKDVGERAGKLIVEERERHGLYKGAGGPGAEDWPQAPGGSSPW